MSTYIKPQDRTFAITRIDTFKEQVKVMSTEALASHTITAVSLQEYDILTKIRNDELVSRWARKAV